MRKVELYRAEDGTTFETSLECLDYEQQLEANETVEIYLREKELSDRKNSEYRKILMEFAKRFNITREDERVTHEE